MDTRCHAIAGQASLGDASRISQNRKGASIPVYDVIVLRPEEKHGCDSIGAVDQLPVRDLPLNSLGHGFFLRGSGTDKAHAQMLAEAASFSELPPILVQRDSLRVIDGMHRLEAAKARGEKFIRARVIDCTDNDAYILAVKANTLHGLPLSRADRTLSARRILDWHPDWSDRAIGIATGLSAKTIAGIRRECADEVQQFTKRLGRDGKRRPITALEGRKRAAEYIAGRPDASLREVARETDVSLGTVQDVRARIRRGLDPFPGSGSDRRVGAAERPAIRPMPTGQPAPGPVEPATARTALLPSRIGPQSGRRAAHSPAWPQIAPKLAGDPSLRYTEAGRAFMRWMDTHMTDTGQWRAFADSIPSHWLDDISFVAEQASEEWRVFAEHLRSRRAEPSRTECDSARSG
jgi:ParB-like chromosome segregation protein Spo0J